MKFLLATEYFLMIPSTPVLEMVNAPQPILVIAILIIVDNNVMLQLVMELRILKKQFVIPEEHVQNMIHVNVTMDIQVVIVQNLFALVFQQQTNQHALVVENVYLSTHVFVWPDTQVQIARFLNVLIFQQMIPKFVTLTVHAKAMILVSVSVDILEVDVNG